MRLLFAVVLAIGCKEKLPIEVGGVDFDYGFFITYPEEGDEPIRVTPTFGVEAGKVVFGGQPSLVLDEDEERFVFVALTAEGLHPSFERARASELEALLEVPPDGPLEVEGIGADLNARTRLPDEVLLLTAELEDAREGLRPIAEGEFELFDEVTLRIPVEPEHCRIVGQTPMAPFAARPHPVQDALNGIENVYYLDQDRALVASRGHVYVIERGATITGTGAIWSVSDDPSWLVYDQMFDLAVGPPASDGSIPLVGVGGDAANEEPVWARIWPLRLRGNAIELDQPSRIIMPPEIDCVPTERRGCDMRFLAATFTPDGRAWVGAADGVIFTRSSTDTEFRRTARLEHRTDISDGFQEMMAIDLGGYRMIAGLKNHIYLLRDDGVWEQEYVMRTGILGPEAIRFATFAPIRGPNDPEIEWWAAGDRGQIARRSGNLPWELLSEIGRELVYPPRFAPCASSDLIGNALGFNRSIIVMEAFEDYVHMGFETCNALITVRRADQCVSLLSIEDQPVAFSTSFITAIDRLGRRLLVGTSGGELYETVLP